MGPAVTKSNIHKNSLKSVHTFLDSVGSEIYDSRLSELIARSDEPEQEFNYRTSNGHEIDILEYADSYYITGDPELVEPVERILESDFPRIRALYESVRRNADLD